MDRSIVIRASAQRVWEVLTQPKYTSQWIVHFGMDGFIDSEWQEGSSVLWKDKDGHVTVAGQITAVEPHKYVHFSVHDTSEAFEGVDSDKDGITYTLLEKDGETALSVIQGDFGIKPEYMKHYHASVAIWDLVLPHIKRIAEAT